MAVIAIKVQISNFAKLLRKMWKFVKAEKLWSRPSQHALSNGGGVICVFLRLLWLFAPFLQNLHIFVQKIGWKLAVAQKLSQILSNGQRYWIFQFILHQIRYSIHYNVFENFWVEGYLFTLSHLVWRPSKTAVLWLWPQF